jgi:hypothetical protein
MSFTVRIETKLRIGGHLRACLTIVGGRRVRARGLREMAKITKPCRPDPLTGPFLKHALSQHGHESRQ